MSRNGRASLRPSCRIRIVPACSTTISRLLSWGGDVTYTALLRPGEAVDEARRLPGAAEAVMGELDVQAVLDRRDEVIHGLDDSGQLPWLQERGVRVVRGRARLTGERTVAVGDQELVARRA